MTVLFLHGLFPTVIFPINIFCTAPCSNGQILDDTIQTTIFSTIILNTLFSDGCISDDTITLFTAAILSKASIQTDRFLTFIYMDAWASSSYTKPFFLLWLKWAISYLDSSSSSSDDDNEFILSALHIAVKDRWTKRGVNWAFFNF
jgi:hypothetical protein